MQSTKVCTFLFLVAAFALCIYNSFLLSTWLYNSTTLVFALLLGEVFFGFDKIAWVKKVRDVMQKRIFENETALRITFSVSVIAFAFALFYTLANHVITISPKDDLTISVYDATSDPNTPEYIGTASKSDPIVMPAWFGKHTYAVNTAGLEVESVSLNVPFKFIPPWGRGLRVEIPTLPTLATKIEVVEKAFIAPSLPDAVEGQELPGGYPDEVQGLPSKKLYLHIESDAAMPIHVSQVSLEVVNVIRTTKWQFPYYREPLSAEAAEIEGFVLLERIKQTYDCEMKSSPRIGKGLDPADFNIRTFFESGVTYTLRVATTCDDPQNKNRGRVVTKGKELIFDCPDDWRQLIGKTSTVQVVFYGEGYRLASLLHRRGLASTSRLFIADPMNENWIKSHPIGDSVSHVICEDEDSKQLIKILGSPKTFPNRPRNCILIDGTTLLLQDASSDEMMSRADQITDQAMIRQLRDALARISQRHGSKSTRQ